MQSFATAQMFDTRAAWTQNACPLMCASSPKANLFDPTVRSDAKHKHLDVRQLPESE